MTGRPVWDRGTRATRERLLHAAQNGDVDALEQLAAGYEPLVQRFVWKLKLPPGCEREDLAQEARVGLVFAIRAWRPERGPFSASADRCVSNQALLALRAAAARKHQLLSRAIPLDEPQEYGWSGLDTTAPPLLDRIAARRDTTTDPELRVLVQEQLATVVRALPALTPSERAGLAMSVNGQSPTRLAATLPGSPHAASQAAHRARRKLAAALGEAA